MENKQSLKNIITTLSQIFFKMIKDLSSLATLEARLAGESLVKIVSFAILLYIFLMCTWISICGCISFGLLYLGFNWLTIFSLLAVLNALVVAFLITRILGLKEDLKFKATKRQFKNVANLKDLTNEYSKIENQISRSNSGQ